MEAYTTVKQASTAEMTEKRSRFIGAVSPVKTEDEAAAFLAEIRAKHRDANHNCFAYALRGNVLRYSDDGEPQGTAGVPILEILKKSRVVDAVIVVTRYFGGTLLGAGGLVRAYSHTAKLALDLAGRLEMRPHTLFSITAPYAVYDRVNLLIQNGGALVLSSDYAENVTLRLRILSGDFDKLNKSLVEATSGVVRAEATGQEFA